MVLVAFYELANQSVFIQAEYGQAVKACIWERKMRLSLQFTDIQEDALALARDDARVLTSRPQQWYS